VIHEAVHAVHAGQYPELSRMYADALAARGPNKESLAILLLKWKAWTEYWAYRGAVEYHNLRQSYVHQSAEFDQEPHKSAIEEYGVKASIARVQQATGKEFEPWKWSPPSGYRAKRGTHEPSRKAR
jgi:hypothetical protein